MIKKIFEIGLGMKQKKDGQMEPKFNLTFFKTIFDESKTSTVFKELGLQALTLLLRIIMHYSYMEIVDDVLKDLEKFEAEIPAVSINPETRELGKVFYSPLSTYLHFLCAGFSRLEVDHSEFPLQSRDDTDYPKEFRMKLKKEEYVKKWLQYARYEDKSSSPFAVMILEKIKVPIPSDIKIVRRVSVVTEKKKKKAMEIRVDPTESSECSFCQTIAVYPDKHQTCSRCRNAWYCSKDCQLKDWKSHKEACKESEKNDPDRMYFKLAHREN